MKKCILTFLVLLLVGIGGCGTKEKVLLMVLLAAVFGFAENWLNQYLIDDIIGNSRYEHIVAFLSV